LILIYNALFAQRTKFLYKCKLYNDKKPFSILFSIQIEYIYKIYLKSLKKNETSIPQFNDIK
jgi:hypothetical protein